MVNTFSSVAPGMVREHERYLNTYPCARLHGQFDYETGKFTHGAFSELDAGFEFYAPQTMEAPDGRRLLVGWMGFLMAKRCCSQPESIIGSIK